MGYKRDNEFLRKFGEHVRSIRENQCLTQESLAHEADLNFSQIARIERGLVNTSITNVKLIAKALNVHPMVLFDFEVED